MEDKDDGDAARLQAPQPLEQCFDAGRRKHRGRLVEDQHPGVGDERAGDFDALLQFDRQVAGIRSINPGSVGVSYGLGPGNACWAVLGPDVELRRTPFSVERAVERYRTSGDPAAERMVGMLESPPSTAEIVEHAERLVFAG